MTVETAIGERSQSAEILRNFNRAIPVFIWISPLLAGLLSLHMGKSMAWDLLHYHYYNGYAFLTNRLNFDILPAVFHTFLNPALDIAFYAAVETLPPRAVGFALGTIHGINIILLFQCARLVLTRWELGWGVAGRLSGGLNGQQVPDLLPAFLAVTGFGTAAAMGTLGSWHHDLIASLFFLGALLVLLRTEGRLTLRRAAAAGLVVGIGLGLKLTLAPFAAAIVAAPLAVSMPFRDRLAACVAAGLGVGVGLLASGGFWMARMYAEFGNPFFPFFNRLFGSPFADAGDGHDLSFLPGSLWEYLIYPVIFSFDGNRISEAPWRDFRLLAAFAMALCLAGIVLGNRLAGRRGAVEMRLAGSATGSAAGSVNARMVLWTALLGYAGWLVLFSIYRYAVPLEMLTPLLLCIMLVILAGPRIGVAATVAGCLFLVAATQKADFARSDWGSEPFVGAEVPAAYQGLRGAVILMAGRSADAHFIPAFDPSNRFVRLDGFRYVYRAEDPFARQAASVVAGHSGPVLAMFRRDRRGQGAEDAFRAFGFVIDDPSCATLESTVRPPEPTFLCRLKRLPAP